MGSVHDQSTLVTEDGLWDKAQWFMHQVQEALPCPRPGDRDLQPESSREDLGSSYPTDRSTNLHSASTDLYTSEQVIQITLQITVGEGEHLLLPP